MFIVTSRNMSSSHQEISTQIMLVLRHHPWMMITQLFFFQSYFVQNSGINIFSGKKSTDELTRNPNLSNMMNYNTIIQYCLDH